MADGAVEFVRVLTSETLPVAGDAADLAAELIRLDWDVEWLTMPREEWTCRRLPQPFLVDLKVHRGLGFARFDALLTRMRNELDLVGMRSWAQTLARPLSADERRLLADWSPHWG